MFGQPSTDVNDSSMAGAPAVDAAVPSDTSMAPADHQMTLAHPDDASATSTVVPTHDPADAGLGITPPQPMMPASDTSHITGMAAAPVAVGAHPDDDLLAIKQDALNALSPLVGQLKQSPEEKFRTTMMMIQASDDRSLVRVAYEAAQAIPDEKARAQALLDVVNEINYFTSQSEH